MNLKKLLGVATLASVFALTACNEEKKPEASVATPSNFFKFIKDPLLMLMLSELTMINAFS